MDLQHAQLESASVDFPLRGSELERDPAESSNSREKTEMLHLTRVPIDQKLHWVGSPSQKRECVHGHATARRAY